MLIMMSYSIWRIFAAFFVLHLLCSVRRTSAKVDGTLMPNRNGSSVVRAVIAKITASEIFDRPESWWQRDSDRFLFMIFLRRMAYVETRDGLVSRPGGIWNVSDGVFQESKTRVCDSSNDMRSRINDSVLNVDWCSISYNDLSKPLYSGLTAALHLDELLRNGTIGNNLLMENQMHKWWGNFKRRADRDQARRKWRDGVDKFEENERERCSIKSDVVFVIDSSISITPSHYNMTNRLVCSFIKKLHGPVDNHVGIILIGTNAVEYKPLGEIIQTGRNISTTLDEICNLPHLQGFTNTADGLCTLSRQDWREDGGVLKLAIVLTDGVSNRNSDNCGGNNTKHMANLIHKKNSDVLVFAIGVGTQINKTELNVIASRRHLTSHLRNYDRVPQMSETFRYQICSTMSAPTRPGNQENGTLAKNEIMRWVLDGVGGDGVTVRLCVRDGGITLYVSQVATPNEEMHDSQSNIARTHKLAIECTTIFNTQYHTPGTRGRRSSEQGGTTSLYLSIEGHDEMNTFFMQSGDGNVTFDVNECKQHPSPCHESALCYNTDGSFYCECRQGYKGDGFHCSSYLFELVAFLIPSVVLGVLLLLGFVLLAIVGIRLNCSAPKAPPKGKRVPTPFTSAGSCSATNPLAINTPA